MEEETPEKSHSQMTEDKTMISRQAEEKLDDSISPAGFDRNSGTKKGSEGSSNEDMGITWDGIENNISLIKAWVEFKKAKAEIKARKQLSRIRSWENAKIRSMEDRLNLVKDKVEKGKAKVVEKIETKIAMIHKAAEQRRLMVEAECREKVFKAEKLAAKYRASLFAPKKFITCFGGH